MTYSFDSFNYWIRMDKGDRFLEEMQRFMKETKLDGAWVSGVGATSECELGFYDVKTKQFKWEVFNGDREILSLQGNIAKNEAGEPVYHLHGTFGDEKYQTIGGHVKDLWVGATLELFVHRSYQPLQRKKNPEVGLEILDV